MKEKTKLILKDYKSKLSYTFLLSGGVSLIILIIFVLSGFFFYLTKDTGYSDVFSILILALFLSIIVGLFSPFIYSYYANYVVLSTEDKEKVGMKSLFKTASFGFKPPYKGLLSSFVNLLFAILGYLILSSIFRTVFFSIYASLNQEVNELFNQVYGLMATNQLDQALEILEKAEDLFYLPEMLSSFFALLVVLFFYFKTLLLNILKYSVVGMFPQLNKRGFNQLFKFTCRAYRKEVNKGFYTYSWPIFVSFFVVFIATYLGLFFGFNLSHVNSFAFLLFISLTSIVFGLIVSLIFYPILFLHYMNFYQVFSLYMRTIFANTVKQNAERALIRMKMSESNEVDYEDILKKIDEEQEKIKSELNEMNVKVDESDFYKTEEEIEKKKEDEENKE